MEDWEEKFRRFGESFLHPTKFGGNIWPLSIEDLYQMFKARTEAEKDQGDRENGRT